MQLTGRCKEDFLNYYWDVKIKTLSMTMCKREDLELFFDSICELFKNALIAEFFENFKYKGQNLFLYFLNYYLSIRLKSQNMTSIFYRAIESCLAVYNDYHEELTNQKIN